jgi:UDP:flavonoid glycosyltransferase YjiC (YdhE family)
MKSASPFSYLDGMSPFLNVYPEPEEFLDGADRAALEPLAFFGALAPNLHDREAPSVFPARRRGTRVYASFGTLIWRYYADAAYAALQAVSANVAESDGEAVISLGGQQVTPQARAALTHPNVRVVDYADQWQALGEADVFVTHHGINSTHESIFHEVPMISYPFLGDQPALARRCQDLGLAVALTTEPRAPVTPTDVRVALARLANDAAGFGKRLAEARSWELRTMSQRNQVVDRIVALAERLLPPDS